MNVYKPLVISLEMGPKAGPMEIILPAIRAMKLASHFFEFKASLRRLNNFTIFSVGTLNSILVVSMLKPKNSPFCEGIHMDFSRFKTIPANSRSFLSFVKFVHILKQIWHKLCHHRYKLRLKRLVLSKFLRKPS